MTGSYVGVDRGSVPTLHSTVKTFLVAHERRFRAPPSQTNLNKLPQGGFIFGRVGRENATGDLLLALLRD